MKDNLDKNIETILKAKSSQYQLNEDFNSRLFSNLKSKRSPKGVFFHASALWSLLALVALIAIICSAYFFIDSEPLSRIFDFHFLKSNGAKYMIYALSALLLFAITDRFIQLKTKTNSFS
jgi:hypothetical protein